MKKIFSLIVAGTLLNFSLISAQTIKQSEVIIPKLNKYFKDNHIYISYSDNVNNYAGKSGIALKSPMVITKDNEIMSVAKMALD